MIRKRDKFGGYPKPVSKV